MRSSAPPSRCSAPSRQLAPAVAALVLGLVACSGGGAKPNALAVTTGRWDPIPVAPVAARFFTATVWNGKELLVWGGRACVAGHCEDESIQPFGDGAAYDPAAGTWRALPPSPLAPRSSPGAVWTGREMVVWGGNGANRQSFADGAAFNPAANTWRSIAASPLSPRTAGPVWTGTEMVVWGGQADTQYRADGAAYSPSTNTWRSLAASPLSARALPASDWTGIELLVWGGQAAPKGPLPAGQAAALAVQDYLADGAAYNPSTDTWRPMAASPLKPRATSGYWTGKAFLVWGGEGPNAAFANGAAYDPAGDTWRAIPTSPMTARRGFASAWTGSELFIWGGAAPTGPSFYGNGAAYDPATGSWRPMKPTAARFVPEVEWAGHQLLVMGGLVLNRASGAAEAADDGARFTP